MLFIISGFSISFRCISAMLASPPMLNMPGGIAGIWPAAPLLLLLAAAGLFGCC